MFIENSWYSWHLANVDASNGHVSEYKRHKKKLSLTNIAHEASYKESIILLHIISVKYTKQIIDLNN